MYTLIAMRVHTEGLTPLPDPAEAYEQSTAKDIDRRGVDAVTVARIAILHGTTVENMKQGAHERQLRSK